MFLCSPTLLIRTGQAGVLCCVRSMIFECRFACEASVSSWESDARKKADHPEGGSQPKPPCLFVKDVQRLGCVCGCSASRTNNKMVEDHLLVFSKKPLRHCVNVTEAVSENQVKENTAPRCESSVRIFKSTRVFS